MSNKDSSYYAVIFTSQQTETIEGYDVVAQTMENLAKQQPGYLGIESARSEIGITVSYWENIEAIKNWKANLDHQMAQKLGRKQWYAWYKVRICKVEREYEFNKLPLN
tara:strand:+ start:12761 stop:13084 length:324 start_codon:yes stop_codon:yes gene_type:complete